MQLIFQILQHTFQNSDYPHSHVHDTSHWMCQWHIQCCAKYCNIPECYSQM